MALIASVVGWLGRTWPGRLLQVFLASQAGNYAAGVAYNAFMSTFPLILGLLAILGFVTNDSKTREQFINAVLTYFPGDSHQALANAFGGVHNYSGLLGGIGIVGLLWGGGNLFTAMEFALGRMFGANPRDFLQQRAMALVMTIAFVVDVVATIGLNSASSLIPDLPRVEPVFGLVVWLGFMAAVYRIVPNRTYRLRELWPGIVLAAMLMEALSLVWPLFAGLSHGFSTYGAALALFFLLSTWMYFLAFFILLGAVAIRMDHGEPDRGGLFSTAKGPPLQTEATIAADQHRNRAA